jgi:AcrR family transcriptional regulator
MDKSGAPAPDVPAETVRRSIVQTALGLAEEAGSWDAVHVHAVAREAGISLEELRRYFGDKDAIAEGYFDIADAALLAVCREPEWGELAIRERLYRAVMAWLDALAPHRGLALEMLLYKIHPEHLHLQARGIARISRTAQWIREVAMLPSVGWRRELEEAAITTMYLTTFSCWLTDKSAGAERTRRLLKRLLATAEQGALWLGHNT